MLSVCGRIREVAVGMVREGGHIFRHYHNGTSSMSLPDR